MTWIKVIGLYAIGAVLWRLGGYRWKWVRRYILPACLSLVAWSKRRKWPVLLTFPLLIGAFSLGYGEKHPYWQKFLVGVAWVLPAVLFLHNWFALAVPFVWIGLFKLSNTPKTSGIFLWWVVEVLIGGLVAVSYI